MSDKTKWALAVLVAVAGVARADENIAKTGAPTTAIPDGGLYVGIGGGLSPDAGAGSQVNALALDRPLSSRFGVWLGGDSTWLARDPEADLILRLVAGVRADLWRSTGGRVRLQATLAFAHQHEAPLSGWEAHPFSNLLGESKDGLGHRSGVDAGVGLLVSPWADRPGDGFLRRVRVLLRLDCTWMPDDKGPGVFLGFTSGVGIAI